jgi:hypothetical protein
MSEAVEAQAPAPAEAAPPFFLCIAPHAWGAGATIAEAQTNCRRASSTANVQKEHLVYECAGPRDRYSVHPVDGSLQWARDAAAPVRVLHHQKGKRADRRRLTIAQLRAMQAVEGKLPPG